MGASISSQAKTPTPSADVQKEAQIPISVAEFQPLAISTSPTLAQEKVEEGKNVEVEKGKKTNKKDKKSKLQYDGRLEGLISVDLMEHLQSVHDEKGEPVNIWGYYMQLSDEYNYGKEIRLLEENSIYTSNYSDIFDNIPETSIPIWKGTDRLFFYQDGEIEVRVAFASVRHAKHFLHCFKCFVDGDSWPRNDSEWKQ